MADIEWDREAHLIRQTGGGEQVEAKGVVHQLVGAFLEMPAEQQEGLTLQVAEADSSQRYDAPTIRELAARPEFTGTYGRYDTANDPDEPDLDDAPDDASMQEGVSGPSFT